jgi:hypothetical protein
LFILGLNIYVAEFLLGMIGSKRDLKQGMLGALTAGFNAGVLHPMKAGFNKLITHGLTGGHLVLSPHPLPTLRSHLLNKDL